MHLTFHKINPKEYKLQIKREDGSEEEAVLDYRSYLKHDLVHFVLEKNAGVSTGFFGKLAGGSSLEDLSPKKGEMPNDPELMVVEMMVGAVQGMLKNGDVDAQRLAEYIRLQDIVPPAYLDDSFLRSIIREVEALIKRYEAMHVGEKIKMEFFTQEPKKSYCADPKSMANIFGKLNRLGNREG